MDVQPSTKSYQLQEGVEGAKEPQTRALPMVSRWGLCFYPPSYTIYGWMTLTKMWVQICLYCSNCTKFGHLILRKIVLFVATRCEILWLKCTKFDFVWGSATDPAGVVYSAPPDPLAAFGGPTPKGRGRGKGREGVRGGEGKWGGKGMGGA